MHSDRQLLLVDRLLVISTRRIPPAGGTTKPGTLTPSFTQRWAAIVSRPHIAINSLMGSIEVAFSLLAGNALLLRLHGKYKKTASTQSNQQSNHDNTRAALLIDL